MKQAALLFLLIACATTAQAQRFYRPYLNGDTVNVGEFIRFPDGSIQRTSFLTQDSLLRDPTGFFDGTSSAITLTDASRKFLIAQTGAGFDVYAGGRKYSKTRDSLTVDNTTGLHYVYFDSLGVLTQGTGQWKINSQNIPVATVYWNATTGAGILGDERHGFMQGTVHEYLHETQGAKFYNGMAGTFAADGSTITVTAGEWYDEDIEHKPAEATNIRMFYRVGSAWKWTAGQARYYDTLTTTPAWDDGGKKTAVSTSKFSATWIFATNSTTYPIIGIMGQAEYNTQALAEAADPSTLSLGVLPFNESLLLYRVIWQRNSGVITWKSTTDYRALRGGQVSNYVATDHASLSHLDYTTAGHTGFVAAGDSATWLATWADILAQHYMIPNDTNLVRLYSNALYAAIGHNHSGVYQPVDADLTTIAGLTATTGNMILAASSAWSSATPSDVKTALSLQNVTNESKATMFTSPTFTGTVSGVSATMVGLGNVTNESKATMFTSPTFTGTVSGVTATHVGLGNVTNESKATMFTSPTFTGTTTFATPFTLEAVSVLPTGTELNFVDGVTSAIQTQLNALIAGKLSPSDSANFLMYVKVLISGKQAAGTYIVPSDTTYLHDQISLRAPIASPTFTGTVSGITKAMVDLSNVTNESKATMFTNPTFTGVPVIPTPFTLGAVSVTSTGTQLNYLNGATGTTGTASTNVVFSEAPTFTGLTTTATRKGTTDSLGSQGTAKNNFFFWNSSQKMARIGFTLTGNWGINYADLGMQNSAYILYKSQNSDYAQYGMDLAGYSGTEDFTTDSLTAAYVKGTTFSIGTTVLTPSGAELNYVDGVTSAIQTQLNAKTGYTYGSGDPTGGNNGDFYWHQTKKFMYQRVDDSWIQMP